MNNTLEEGLLHLTYDNDLHEGSLYQHFWCVGVWNITVNWYLLCVWIYFITCVTSKTLKMQKAVNLLIAACVQVFYEQNPRFRYLKCNQNTFMKIENVNGGF